MIFPTWSDTSTNLATSTSMSNLPLRDVNLDDKYEPRSSTVLLSGTQALIRMLLMQRARDAAQGLRTAGFVSGYRGSPLGTFDLLLWKERRRLEAGQIRFQPGVNEDLAATAVWGTQQVALVPDAKVDGVFALWYGKGPGPHSSSVNRKRTNGFFRTVSASLESHVIGAFGRLAISSRLHRQPSVQINGARQDRVCIRKVLVLLPEFIDPFRTVQEVVPKAEHDDQHGGRDVPGIL